jgi:NAD(P)-dependent dehydrogenase (short-subunit alcohol dehydrogenase family)
LKELGGKVVVVTGGASGIGRAMAERFAAEKMKVVVADVEATALARVEAELKASGASVLAVRSDVSRAADVEELARQTIDAFGAVHVLCNNAGVSPVMRPTWELTETDWQWVLGVNLWGVLHGIRAFVPIMLKQDSEGHIVNTASLAGLIGGGAWWATYGVSKHGVVNLSESLHRELAAVGSRVKVSVLCPAWVKTQLMDAERNRPASLRNEHESGQQPPPAAMMEQAVRQFVEGGTDPGEIAGMVVDAIWSEKFYILPHPEWKEQIRTRMEDIIEERNPAIVVMP